MYLTAPEVQQAIAQAQAAFPYFREWEYNNEEDADYLGFSLWGWFVLDTEEQTPGRFFVTLDTYEDNWYGHLTIGQPNYFWTSADMGDARLIDTEACSSLGEAIAALKMKTARLYEALSIA